MSSTSNLHFQSSRNLIDILRTSFRQSQYDEVVQIFYSREKFTAEKMSQITIAKAAAEKRCSILESKCADLENKIKMVDSAGERCLIVESKCAVLENKFKMVDSAGDHRTVDLEQMLKQEKYQFSLLDLKYGKLEQTLLAAKEETEKYKKISDELQEKLDCATADLTLMYANDQLVQERIGLMEELQLKEQEMAAKFNKLQLKSVALEQTLKEEKERFSLLDIKYKDLEKAIFFAEEEADKYREISDKYEEQLDRATKDFIEMYRKDNQSQNHINLLNEELRKTKQAVAEIEHKLFAAKGKAERYQKIFEELQNELGCMRKDQFLLLDLKYGKLEQTLFATKEEKEKYQKTSFELQEKLDRATADLALMYAKDQLAQERISITEELQLKEREKAAKFVKLQLKSVALEQTLKEEKERFSQLDIKYKDLEKAIFSEKEEADKYRKISDRHEEDLDRTTKDLIEIYRKNNQSQNSINLLKDEVRKNEQVVLEIEQDWSAAKGEAEKYKTISEELQNELGCVTKDLNRMREKYKRAQDRMVSMQEELLKLQEVAAKFVEPQLENENINLGEQQAEEETSKWKRMYSEVQARETKLLNENLNLQARTAALERKFPPNWRRNFIQNSADA